MSRKREDCLMPACGIDGHYCPDCSQSSAADATNAADDLKDAPGYQNVVDSVRQVSAGKPFIASAHKDEPPTIAQKLYEGLPDFSKAESVPNGLALAAMGFDVAPNISGICGISGSAKNEIWKLVGYLYENFGRKLRNRTAGQSAVDVMIEIVEGMKKQMPTAKLELPKCGQCETTFQEPTEFTWDEASGRYLITCYMCHEENSFDSELVLNLSLVNIANA